MKKYIFLLMLLPFSCKEHEDYTTVKEECNCLIKFDEDTMGVYGKYQQDEYFITFNNTFSTQQSIKVFVGSKTYIDTTVKFNKELAWARPLTKKLSNFYVKIGNNICNVKPNTKYHLISVFYDDSLRSTTINFTNKPTYIW